MTSPASLPKPKKLKVLGVRRVVGTSMTPALTHGRILLVVPPFRVRQGDIVVIYHDGREKIKRVAAIKNGAVYVLGDNPAESTDSRHFGWLDREVIIAKVVAANRYRAV